MNTDYTKPPVAPKPRLHCHASLRLPSPLMSRAVCATRGPKPPVAPKPIVPHDLNVRELLLSGPQEGCSNGGLFASDEELEQDNEPEDILTWACTNQALVKSKLGFYSIRPGQRPLQNGLTEEGGAFKQELAEHWRDSAAEDSLEVHGLTADSSVTDGDMVDHVDAGEALADADGLSVGDLSVSSVNEEELRSDSGAENRHLEDTFGKLQWQEDEGTKFSADEMTDSLIQQHVAPGNNSNTELSLSESTKEEEVKDHNGGVTCYTSKEKSSHELKKRTKEFQAYSAINEEHININDIIPAYQKQLLDTNERHSDLEVDAILEPYYISSEDIIGRRFSLMGDKGDGLAYGSVVLQKLLSNNVVPPSKYRGESQSGESILTRQTVRVSSEGQMETDTNNEYDRDNKMSTASPRQTRISSRSQAREVVNAEASLDDHQPRFRLVSISVPTEADTSMSSSFSESHLMSPNDTGDDLDGHIVPFLDDTTDSERYLNDEHVYEEAGHDSEGENVLSFNNRAMVMRSCSLSPKGPDYVKGAGSEVNIQKYSVGGYGLTSPTMSSSPLLNSVRTKSYSEPPRLAIYPRSYSMEGRDASLCVYKETHSFPQEERRREHALSLSYALNASGSFSQRSPVPSSGLSTPTSLVDIPPPFELACITKKPITKSFPSLLIEGDSPDKTKKKKSAFKRFLLLKFRRKADAKPAAQAVSPSSSRASTESSHSAPSRLLDVNKKTGGSPRPTSRCGSTPQGSSVRQSTLSFYKDGRRIGGSAAFLSRSVVRVESFEDRSKLYFVHVPLTKPRSISFPNTDAASDYENIPAVSSDYENIQVPQQRPVRQETFTEFFDRPSRARSSANETDGYVDMSSLPGFERNTRSTADETESAYTEAYNVCSMAVGPSGVPPAEEEEETAADEDQGRTSEEEDGGIDSNYDRRPDGRPRAFYIAKELVDTEKLHVEGLKHLQEDFREAVKAAVGEEGNPVLEEERLREILNELPDVYALHCTILTELKNRIETWEDGQRIAEVLLSRKSQFLAYTTYIGHYDRSMTLLEESCRTSPAFAAVVRQFEQQKPAGGNISLQHQLLQVIVRVAQYRMLLTDYLNNLSPDSKEYEDTQAAVAIVSDIADQANDSLRNGDNLLRLVNIEYSVRGQRDLLKPGRVFVKEGTLMKVSRKSRQPRHLFLMNDVLLYTYPQQDGKYRLKNTLSLTRMKITKPNIDNAQNALKIEGTDISIILLASSCSERDDWFYTLTRAVTEHERGTGAFTASGEARERLWMTSLGEKAPTLVPVSQAMMCMNCTADFSLTLRRHHCHACGRIVCRSCSRNRYPLKYMKDRLAKVCDHCYSELRKRGEDVSVLTNRNSLRLNHSSRPLSAVFQNIHPPSLWRHRKGTASFNPVTVSEEGSISGSLQRSKRSKRHWKRLWFLLKDKVLYTYRAKEEKVASETLPLLGFTVKLPDRQDWVGDPNVFQLYHKKTLYYTFKAEDNYTAQRWVNAMEEATVL